MTRLAVVDAPVDSSGAGRGEEHAAEALRAAGLVERLGARDAGGTAAHIRDTERDPGTGVIGAADVRRGSTAIASVVAEVISAGDRPLVLGGDCTLLLGVFRALPRDAGLWFIDGHADFFDGHSSPTGEAADMDLAILTGHGPPGLLDEEGPLLEPAGVVLIGHRPSELHPDVAAENARLDPAIHAVTAPEVRERGAAAVGVEAAARLAARSAWLHLDLDALDESALPAVSYPQARGLDWDELVAIGRHLVAAPNLLGVSVADFNPDRDPDGAHAARVVDALESIWGTGGDAARGDGG
ncbi:MAG TPA: arginase family protein [Solirubrobacterales bacterium]|nr:arginase family protein [Solirubrobacterales bacterium]